MAIATATAIALAAAAASAGLTGYNTIKTANKQDATAAEGIRKQGETQRQANARLNQTVEQARQSTPDDERKLAGGQYLDQIARQLGQAKTGLQTRGISSEFDKLAKTEGAGVGQYGKTIADLFARMDAPVLQRQGEANSYGNLGMDLSVLQGNAGQDAFLNQLKLKNIQRNPYIDLAAGIAKGISGAGLGAGSPAAAPYTATGYGSTWGTGNGLKAAGY